MKISIIASIMALGMVSGLAQATAHDVTFTGSVTNVTCDLGVTGGGSNVQTQNVVDLGQVNPNQAGKVVEFAFKPAQVAGNQTACDAMDANGTAKITWQGTTFDGNGLGKTSGTAEGAHVELMALNAKAENNKPVTSNGTAHEFSGDKLKTGGEGLKYSAKLTGGAVAGDFEAVARYTFDYK
ncbi:fimbrial protein [Escherichia coli]|jgi:hypothetical protein|nr:fimbrial protein [Escherichia coli]EFH6854278.1 fimbrial protein [Escherichia coli]EFI5594886.1 fimbrial protein [Escherichia coli]EFI6096247.1 fimbrial protein [Escherichia coli]EFI8984903.1 fimbrial protein [Escherichia coli]